VDALVGGPVALAPEADEDFSDSEPERSGRSDRPRRHRSWRRGGTSVRRWGWELFGWALLSLGLGVIGAAIVAQLVGGQMGAVLSALVLWVGFAVPIGLALARSRPRGIFVFRPVDLLYAVVLGGLLRLAQGYLSLAAGGTDGWPLYPSIAGQLPSSWLFDQVVASILVAPVLEELFFRVVVLVAVYSGVRRIAGRGVAFFASAVASTGLFVLAHAILGTLTWDAVASLSLVGLTASILVLTTGRIWGAILVHIVYNASWVLLATAGTLLAA